MVKRVLLGILFTVIYLIAFAAGSFLHPLGLVRAIGSQGLTVRLFIWDGVLVMLTLYGLTLGIEALGRRFRDLAPWTTASLVLAALLGYLLRLGFVTREF